MQGVEGVTADEEFLEGGVGEAGCKPDGDMGNGSRRDDQESPHEAVRPGRGECLARLRRLRGARGVDLGGPGHRHGPARRARLRPLPRCRLRSHHGATGTRRPQANRRSVPGIRHGAAGSSSRPRRRARGKRKVLVLRDVRGNVGAEGHGKVPPLSPELKSGDQQTGTTVLLHKLSVASSKPLQEVIGNRDDPHAACPPFRRSEARLATDPATRGRYSTLAHPVAPGGYTYTWTIFLESWPATPLSYPACWKS